MRDSTRSVDELVAALTRAEKLELVHGAIDPEGTATGYLPGVERLDIPAFRMADGPLGVRVPGESGTAFPAATALAATFDPELARRQGAALGREAKAHGQHALLGPGLNLVRVPHCGRNFEYFSEDPVLTGAFAASVVAGVQSEDVVATPKHYVANNQETKRVSVSADVSERALRECYLPGFRDAVEAGAGSVMTAYNRVNGTYMSEHDHLLGDVLKGEWGFAGYVVSDWYGMDSTVDAANAGLDVEMPGVPQAAMMEAFGVDEDALAFEDHDGLPDGSVAGLFGDPLGDAIAAGDVPEARLDDMVRRVLGQMDRIGVLDDAGGDAREGALDTPAHRDLAETVAARGTVLLENDGVLPLTPDAAVAVVGPNVEDAMLGGGGSSEMQPFRETATAAGIRDRATGPVTVEQGVPAIEDRSFFEPGDAGDDESGPEPDLDAATAAAADADVAVVVVRDSVTEAEDRDDLRLPGRQDELVDAVAAASDRTVVVLQTSGPVELPWRDDVDAILETWYPGQADGDAAAAVLYGDRDPGGRLPVTFAPEDAYPTADEHRFPGVDGTAHYDEGVFVGYRYFDDADATPTYPFGHGHSYASFTYEDAALVDDETVRVTVSNDADRAGREVVQVYVRPPAGAGVDRPVRELAGFRAIDVPAGDSETVTVDLDRRAFARYDGDVGDWVVDEGTYVVEVSRAAGTVEQALDVECAERTGLE